MRVVINQNANMPNGIFRQVIHVRQLRQAIQARQARQVRQVRQIRQLRQLRKVRQIILPFNIFGQKIIVYNAEQIC
jgi:hypothetical protein